MRSIASLIVAFAAASCGDPFDHSLAEPRLTAYLASTSSPQRTLAEWVGGDGASAICFLDEFTTPRATLDYYASIGLSSDGLPLRGSDERVPEGALGVLIIREEEAAMALVPQQYLFDPGSCYRPSATLRRSSESPRHWVIDGERLLPD